MADLISSVASTAIESLNSSVLQEVASAWNFKSDLLRLANTITTVRDVILAHDGVPVLGFENLIERLKDVVHEADDLLDKFTTLVERKRLSHGRFTKVLRRFFSRDNKVVTACIISREIKRIEKTLNDIVGDREHFASMLPSKDAAELSNVVKGRETCSFVIDEDVIGRDDEKQRILDALLRYDHHDDPLTPHVVVLPIVGTGGLGKTIIAQLVYNDEKVKKHFEPRLWMFVGDGLHVEDIIRKISMPATDDRSLEQIHNTFREKMGGKQYLLVLDDVWIEDPHELLQLRTLLSVGERGSRVLVTTRSMFTAGRIGTLPPLELQLLSDEASWILFAKVAFRARQEQQKDECLVRIGKKIAKKCGNLPLAIKVIGSLLQGEDETKWRYFIDNDLAKIDEAAGIMPLLKLSYSFLRPQLKQCFIYCSLFPKGSEIDKVKSCHLWMAQGFIESSKHPAMEDVAHQCFMELLNRSLFQKMQSDEDGEIISFLMHDMVHDLAQEVAGKEIISVDGGGDHISLVAGTRHLSIGRVSSMRNLPSFLHEGGSRLRTLLQYDGYNLERSPWKVSDLIACLKCIKVLDLSMLRIEQLPDSIGRLIHLRYLDLSFNNFEMLPKSFTKLLNLETLNLANCVNLKELPTDLSKLVNLQNLDIDFCNSLTHMPSGMGSLACLRRLTKFVLGSGQYVGIGHSYTCCNSKPRTINASGIDDLILLKELRGHLTIMIDKKGIDDNMIIRTKADYLLDKKELSGLYIMLYGDEVGDGSQDEKLLQSLRPHRNVRNFILGGYYGGQKFPGWMSMNNLSLVLPNLVMIELRGCKSCQHLPVLSQLPSLRSVYLIELRDVQYIENNGYEASASTSVAFFPSLEYLELRDLSNAKGWRTPAVFETELGYDRKHLAQRSMQPSFPRLSELHIRDCPNMASMPLCPSIKNLFLLNFNQKMCVTVIDTEEWTATRSLQSSSSSSTTISSSSSPSLLTSLTTDNIDYLNHLSKSSLNNLAQLTILMGEETALRGSFLQHLTALEDLTFDNCSVHDREAEEEEADEMSWRFLRRLRRLEFYEIPQLAALPKGIKYLTNLQDLRITSCHNLVEVPEWISQLSSSLQCLQIEGCPELKALPEGVRDLTSLRYLSLAWCDGLTERCKKPTGEDWPKIRHVPEILLPEYERVYQTLIPYE